MNVVIAGSIILGGIDLREEQFQLTQSKFEFYNFGIPTEHSCFVIMIEHMIEPDYLHAEMGRW